MRGMLDRPEQELILVADDSQEVRERIGALLVERYQVRLVAADQALAAACEAPQPDLMEVETPGQVPEAVLNQYQNPHCICFLPPTGGEGSLYRDPGGVSGFGSVSPLVHRARAPYLRIAVEVIALRDDAGAARHPVVAKFMKEHHRRQKQQKADDELCSA